MWPFKPKSSKQTKLVMPREGAATYQVGGGWGDRIEWLDKATLTRIAGWKTVKPQEGDVLTCEMQSGKTAVWLIQTVEHCGNPRDMFFADVLLVGYKGEIDFDLPPAPKHPMAGLFRPALV
jgi:hypothetical protein